MPATVKEINSLVDISPYRQVDENAIPSKNFTRLFGESTDYVEQHIYTSNGVLLLSDYNFKEYSIPDNSISTSTTSVNTISFNPDKDLRDKNFSIGTYVMQYNILRKKVYNSTDAIFLISEISSDRKELRITSNKISNSDIETGIINLINEIQTTSYYKDFLLNFSNNRFITAVNVALDKNTTPYTFLLKLYEPLPSDIVVNSSFFIVEELSNSYGYQVELIPELAKVEVPTLRSPNFNLNLDYENNSPSEYVNIENLFSSDYKSSYQKLLNKIKDKQIKLNVDYTDYSNFVHFSSAKERLNNFVYKLQLVENYQNDINTLKSVINYVSSSNVINNIYVIQNKIDNVIEKFDDYEHFLYYEVDDKAWPKYGSTHSQSLYSTTSSEALTWLGSDETTSEYYGGQSMISYEYDLNNPDNLIYTIPEFIRIDPSNEPFSLFLNMIGHHYDSIWVVIKSLTDLYKNTNSPKTGISKDLVYYALRNMGIKLYNSKGDQNIYSYLLGTDATGSYSNYTVTASTDILSGLDQQKEIYKRVYHNLPYLLKSKGTNRGLKALISTFGIPETILDINEYGGSDKNNNTYDYENVKYTYALNLRDSYVNIPWVNLSQNITKNATYDLPADTIEFRIKPNKTPDPLSQDILMNKYSGGSNDIKFKLSFEYTQSNENNYGNLIFSIPSLSQSISIPDVPFWNTGSDGDTSWWNIMLRRRYQFNRTDAPNNENYYDVFIKNKVGNDIGFEFSSSYYTIFDNDDFWYGVGDGVTTISETLFGPTFNGQIQEVRYWSIPLSEDIFDVHVMNSDSIQGNDNYSAYNDLAARFTLGNNLYTYNHAYTTSVDSTHPNQDIKISGSLNSAAFINFLDEDNYSSFIESQFSSINTAYSNPVTQKIRISNDTKIGNVLLRDKSIVETNGDISKDIHFTDISFSPTNQIDNDIISQFGTNLIIDDFIGNPEDSYLTSYPDLDDIKKEYFKKYIKTYDFSDFVRLIGFFDNSLFKMIEDFAPARSNIQTGLLIKPHILERNKIKNNKPQFEEKYNYFESEIGDIRITADSINTDSLQSELPGGIIDIKNDIDNSNKNPYEDFIENIDIPKFINSDFNCILGNVYDNQVSTKFMELDIFNPQISSSAHVQDYVYEMQRYVRSRYEGSILTNSEYNIYNPSDITFGKSPSIYRNSVKFGWVKNIPSQSLNFNDKTSINLKYLVDNSGSLTELSKHNKNLFEVQNIFKSGDKAIVSISDPLNPSFQTSLNGNKNIWRGGYSFDPIVYRENNESLTFKLDTPYSSSKNNFGVSARCKDYFKYYSPQGSYRPSDGVGGYTYYKNGIQQNASQPPMAKYINWLQKMINDPLISTDNHINFYKSAFTRDSTNFPGFAFDLFDFNNIITNNESEEVYNNNEGIYHYNVPRTSVYELKGQIPFFMSTAVDNQGGSAEYKIFGLVEKCEIGKDKTDENNWFLVSNNAYTVITPNITSGGVGVNPNTNSITYDNDPNLIQANCKLNVTANLNQGDCIRFRFYMLDVGGVFFGSSIGGYTETLEFLLNSSFYPPFNDASVINQAFFEIKDQNTYETVYYDTVKYDQTPLFFSSTSSNTVVFDYETYQVFNSSSIFIPSNSSKKYYSPIVDNFDIQKNDILRIGSFLSPTSKYYNVVDVQNKANTTINSISVIVSFVTSNNPNYVLAPGIQFVSSTLYDFKFKVGNTINITGASDVVNNGDKVIKYIYKTAGMTYVIFTTSVVFKIMETITITFPVGSISTKVLTLDSNISGSNDLCQNFAILRPKEDETSVILNYKKQPGEVSQTLLLPYDLNEDIKKDVANISKKLINII